METGRMSGSYFEWMVHLVSDGFGRGRSYRKLMELLHSIEFSYILDMDANRADDGTDLRYRFAYEMAEPYIPGDNPPSVLEVMVALAIRIEENIMEDPAFGDRTGQWFMTMIRSLGLSAMTDKNFHQRHAEEVIFTFLRREHDRDGRGGLFYVPKCPEDLRKTEIWTQMIWFLDQCS